MIDHGCPSLDTNATIFVITFSDWAREYGLLKFNFWFFSTICKIVPCALLIVMTVLLTLKMLEYERRSRALQNRCQSRSTAQSSSSASASRQYRMTTYFILTVVILFILVELPLGIVNLLMGVYGDWFTRHVYLHVADLFNMLTMLYSSINFFLYCFMNGQFRSFITARCVASEGVRALCEIRMKMIIIPMNRDITMMASGLMSC